MALTHTRSITVSFDESDPAGILFFGRFFAYAHRHIEDFTRISGIGWENWFAHPDWAVPLRHAETEYLKPLRAGETYSLELRVSHLGQSSVQFENVFLKDSVLCARVKTTHVFALLEKEQKMPIPANIREVLSKYLKT